MYSVPNYCILIYYIFKLYIYDLDIFSFFITGIIDENRRTHKIHCITDRFPAYIASEIVGLAEWFKASGAGPDIVMMREFEPLSRHFFFNFFFGTPNLL